MASRMTVKGGRDDGLEIILGDEPVRIGRHIFCNVKLTDPGISGKGYLVVTCDRAAYSVRNNLGYICTYEPSGGESEAFDRKADHPWFEGGSIYLSPEVRVVLGVDDSPPLVGRHQVVGEPADAQAKRARDLSMVVAIVVLLGLNFAVWTLESEPTEASSTPRETSLEYSRVREGLGVIQGSPDEIKAAKAILARLGRARLAELSGRAAEAFDAYAMARDELSRIAVDPVSANAGPRRVPADQDAFQETWRYLNRRLIALGQDLGPSFRSR